jgi:ankyrin repeat protein
VAESKGGWQRQICTFDLYLCAALRQWVEANPGRVNDRDRSGRTPLYVAACDLKSLSLTTWLLDEKGADVNGKSQYGNTPLHRAASLDILNALLERAADPTIQTNVGWSPLMDYTIWDRTDLVKRMLQDPRVRASIDVQNRDCDTALHFACHFASRESVAPYRPEQRGTAALGSS